MQATGIRWSSLIPPSGRAQIKLRRCPVGISTITEFMRALWLYAFLILSCGAATVEDKKMDTKIQDLIANKVHAEQGWKTDEVRVDAEDDLRHGSCSFYSVRNKVRPMS